MKLITRRSKKSGLPPGTVVHIGEERKEPVKITALGYGETFFEEKVLGSLEPGLEFTEKPSVTWLNVDGVHQSKVIEEVGKKFDLHPLTLEDIANTDQRPKMEEFEEYLFVVLRMLQYDERTGRTRTEQVSMVLKEGLLVSFQEVEGDVFDSLRGRIRMAKGRVRKMGADYLAYSLMDAIVDNYFLVLEKFGEIIEDMEEQLVTNPTPETLQTLYDMKREMIFLRKSVWPLREVINR